MKTIEMCPYRQQKFVCTLDARQCNPCLQGQLIDIINLQVSSIMNLTASLEENKVCST